MSKLYVVSWSKGGGKTALCAGIGNHLRGSGKKMGYLKPVALTVEGASPDVDKDAQFIQQALGLENLAEALCPFSFGQGAVMAELQKGDFSEKLSKVSNEISKDKDMTLFEGWGDLGGSEELLKASCQMADMLDAKVVMVVAYNPDLPWDKIASSAKSFAQRLLGVVINQVPQKEIQSVEVDITARLSKDGVKVLGALPEDRSLLGVSVADLAEDLQAEVLCCPESTGDLVENLMIGALSVDSGADYFSLKDNKAVIARSDRSDIQLAALATSTKCLILSGDVAPIPQVLNYAEDKGIPVLSVKQDVLSIADEIEKTFLKARFQQQEKLEGLGGILEKSFKFQAFYGALGVAS